MNGNAIKQILLYGYQFLFSFFLFDLPVLYKIKAFCLMPVLKMGPKGFIGKNTFFVTSHATQNGIGTISLGENVLVKSNCEIDYSGNLIMGDNVRIASGVFITTHGHDFKTGTYEAQKNNITFSSLEIKDNVVIGTGAKILHTCTVIGEGSVIGAGAVVIKDVPDRTIMMGNPARPVYKREDGKAAANTKS